jgi:hypothetical protein
LSTSGPGVPLLALPVLLLEVPLGLSKPSTTMNLIEKQVQGSLRLLLMLKQLLLEVWETCSLQNFSMDISNYQKNCQNIQENFIKETQNFYMIKTIGQYKYTH